MIDRDTLMKFSEEVAKVFLPLRKSIESPDNFNGFMRELGWEVLEIPEPIEVLGSHLTTLSDILQEIIAGTANYDRFNDLRNAIRGLMDSIEDIKTASSSLIPPLLSEDNFQEEFPSQLVQYLVVEYLIEYQPLLGTILGVMGLIRIEVVDASGNRPGYVKREMAWEDIPELLTNPTAVFEKAYGWGTNDFRYQNVFEHLQDLLYNCSIIAYLEEVDPRLVKMLEKEVAVPGNPVRWSLKIPIYQNSIENILFDAGLALFALPENGNLKPGLSFLPYATGEFTNRFPIAENLYLTIESGFDLNAGTGILLRPGQPVELLTDIIPSAETGVAPPSAGFLTLRLEYTDTEGEALILIGSVDGSRLQAVGTSIVAGVLLDNNNQRDFYIEFEIQGGKLIITSSSGDGFIQRLLPEDGINAPLDMVVGWSSARGFYFRGSSALEVNIPTHFEFAGIEFQSVNIRIHPSDGGIPVSLGASFKTKLGPILATVENIGLSATFKFPGRGGNLGPIDISISFKSPAGIGLAIDGGGFKGGGFLSFDQENARYAGILQLEFNQTVALKAIGLLTTRLPGGQEGFSLLVIISAEFNPIQLGLGFTLNGVGGLLGLNRTMKVEPLREGVQKDTLDHILFPSDPVANANRIISDLRQIFPPQEGRFVFGPMAIIGWGTPTLIAIEMGLVIEVPNPVRLAILGVIKAALPDEEEKLLIIQVNFLGFVDFEKKQLSFDASLFESRLLTYTLAGDMALRLYWGQDANFLLTVGGFHPAYTPPPMSLPALKRLSLTLTPGDNPRIRVESYYAVTSNTVQFGAQAELYAASGSYNIYGFLGFDALFQFSPFHFIAEIRAALALRKGTSAVMGVGVSVRLAGPTPWKANGSVTVKILFVKIKVKFNKIWGEEREALPEAENVLPKLIETLENKNNWQPEIPAQFHMLTTTKDLSNLSERIIVHPFGLVISQKLVPLNINIDKFSSAPPADYNRFNVNKVIIGEGENEEEIDCEVALEQFAPAQFQKMSDSERLASKSFEKLQGGVWIRAADRLQLSTKITKRDVEYECIIIDRKGRRDKEEENRQEDQDTFNALLNAAAAARSPLSHARIAPSPLAPPRVSVTQEKFTVVNGKDLKTHHKNFSNLSQAEARSRLKELISQNPKYAETLQIIPVYEVNN